MARTGASGRDAPVVAAQGLTRIFKDFWMRDRARAVDNLSFEIAPREIFGLLGPNGSGKSTTIKMILGLLRPTRGRIAVFSRPPTDVPIKERIGYLPEESYLYGYLNARETLEYYAKLFAIPAKVRNKRIDELLEMVGLTAAQHRPVSEYSKGMQRRIGLAQALINDPDFLILDEPTTGLDPIATRQVKDVILRLGQRGKTVLLSSHLLADVEDVVDRMVILYGGKMREEGSCDDLLVSHSRTTLEIDAQDESLVSDIDELLRARSHGQRGVIHVSHPRQTLEEKFLEIVSHAREERAETSGAVAGEIASFLAAPSGTDLIDSLIDTGDDDIPPPEFESHDDQPEEPPRDVLAELINDENEPQPQEPEPLHRDRPQEQPIDTAGVDEDVIGSLLDNDEPEPQT